MDAHKSIIQEILNSYTLIEVPFFQRSYVWKEDLWQRFLNDMEFVTKTRKSHFLGTVILKMGRKPTQTDSFTICKTIVDGQQRLTTFLIFMKVLCLKKGEPSTFNSNFMIGEKLLSLHHGRSDKEDFEKVAFCTNPEEIERDVSSSKIIQAFNFFIKNLDETKLDIMTMMRNVQFVRIDLDENEDEQQIFDTINSLGVNLTTSELLKNYFFNRDTIQEYESKWESVFEKDDDTKAYWNTELETGRIKRAMIDIFFDAYFQMFIQNREYNIANEDKLMYSRVDSLSQSYQHFISTYCGGNKNIVLGYMRDYALCFMNTFKIDQCERNISADFGVERLNVIIFGLKNTTLIPYILFVEKNVEDNFEKNKIYGILESYIMRRIIVRASTKNYNNLFRSLILNRVLDTDTLLAKLKYNDDITTSVPDDNELCEGIRKSKLVNLQSKGIIYLLESKMRPSNSSTALLGFNQYSLEHLMPKKWRNNWSSCKTEDLERKRDSILLTLGNLAIIPQSLNSSIRDAAWSVKKNGKGQHLGLNKCANGLHTFDDVLDKENWNENEILKRSDWFYEKAKSVWKL